MTARGRWCAAAGTGVVVALLSGAVANADTQVDLPDGHQTLTTAPGVPVDLSRTGEHAVVSPSLAANGLSRTASMSATVYAKVPGATKGTLVTGYLVGCQVDLSGGLSLGGDAYISPDGVSPELAPSINLVPGGVAVVRFDTKTLDPGAGAVGVTYQDRAVQVEGCAGYAQARAFTTLTVSNDRGTAEVTLYGRPFGIG
ncbi:MspA domain-containing protein [Nocardia nova SH22a]|uniref:MspA domain-containing protein n=1 Tax=Nocardia nova SH22a TaxID=1415166 RepID=W5T9M6_9NOCA|nr:MspA family porin [Nocardia nova]AHH15839.1 MspA domain-containing protein [Nocardia nova SH22a]